MLIVSITAIYNIKLFLLVQNKGFLSYHANDDTCSQILWVTKSPEWCLNKWTFEDVFSLSTYELIELSHERWAGYFHWSKPVIIVLHAWEVLHCIIFLTAMLTLTFLSRVEKYAFHNVLSRNILLEKCRKRCISIRRKQNLEMIMKQIIFQSLRVIHKS